MDVSHLLDPLNEAQRAAVTAGPGQTLVLAGAGSGKTRVLVHRMAWLITVEGRSPYGLLAVTFTNKAAREMRERIERLLGLPPRGMWVGTFHGLAHRLLGTHWQDAELPQTFQVIDAEDQKRLIRRTLAAMGLSEAKFDPRSAQWFVNTHKDEGLRAEHLEVHTERERALVAVYQEYDKACRRAGLVDFAELLLRVLELWRAHPELLAHYRERFEDVLVDEFQDTNAIQYAWLRLLAGDDPKQAGNLFVVGDDDQSIYGWRGARMENLRQVTEDYPQARLVRLEQNYRSTGTILAAANALIERNVGRLGKKLWTSGEDGDPVLLYAAFNEQDEARFVVERVRAWVEAGRGRGEAAILYRSNAQSRVFEEYLVGAGLAYRVYGGLRFFDRAEVKDALAYLRLTVSRQDDAAFERVVNMPPRGIGARTVDQVRATARAEQCSLWEAIARLRRGSVLSGRARKALAAFVELIEALEEAVRDAALATKVEHAVAGSGLLDHYRQDTSERAQSRVENLEELVNAARTYQYEAEDEDPLSGFLTHAALEAGEAQGGGGEDSVQLMTLHSAKGLEFPLVFLVGMEEGLFPHERSVTEPGRLEEERRLCYVGMTRAMRQLYLVYAESRRRNYGSQTYPEPSRFVREIPSHLLREVRVGTTVIRPVSHVYTPAPAAAHDLPLGQRVRHPKFGEGTVVGYEGRGAATRVQVRFEHEQVGEKWLIVAYANLTAVAGG